MEERPCESALGEYMKRSVFFKPQWHHRPQLFYTDFFILSDPKANTMKYVWGMIWQEKVDKTVLVTQLVEERMVTFYYS